MKVLAILESMWDPQYAGRPTPARFRINPQNYTGKRLYWWLGSDADLWVTNACATIVANASKHSEPDPKGLFLRVNYSRLNNLDLLLVCGKVAEQTFYDSGLTQGCAERIMFVPHPAARVWTKHQLDLVHDLIQYGKLSVHCSFKDGRLCILPADKTECLPF